MKFFLSSYKKLSLIAVVSIIFAIPLTISLLHQQRETQQDAAGNNSYPANIDYAAGGYGAYIQADLTNPNIAGVDINMNWSNVEPVQGNSNFAPLDKTLSDWAKAGKKVVLILRFADEVGGGCPGGMLPVWEINRIPTFCDTDLNSTIPDYFNPTFQTDWKAFVKTVGDHINQSAYRSSIAYVRAATGLAGEGFFLTYEQGDFATDKDKLVSWGYSPAAWQNFQQSMMSYYKSVFPFTPVIYSIVKLDNDSQVQTAEWAADNGMGVGQQGVVPGDYPTDYAKMKEILAYIQSHDPSAYVQFQTLNSVTDATTVQGIIQTAESMGGRSVEWYENITDNSTYQSLFQGWQQFVNNKYGNLPTDNPSTQPKFSPTVSPTGQTSQGPTPTTVAGGTSFSVTVCPHGLGNCGDNVNANSGGNTNLNHQSRTITLSVLNSTGQPVGTGQGSVLYNTTAQNFQGTVSVNLSQSGQYLASVKLNGFLSKQVSGFITVTKGQAVTLPSVSVVTGDINNDNQLDLLDYNLLISCFGSKQTTASCTTPPTTTSPGADINDDGVVDGIDYNLFLRELSVQKGSGGDNPTSTPTKPNTSPTSIHVQGNKEAGVRLII